MSNLTRWNPFRARRIDPFADFDSLFRELSPMLSTESGGELRIDVSEDDKSYSVKADMPGIDKQDIDVSIDGNRVTISGESKRETKKGECTNEVVTERYYGRTFRAFTLPVEVDAAKAEARCDNGVLTLQLPKKPNGSARRISVS